MFHSLFGVEPNEIQKTCVLTPFIYRELVTDLQTTPFHRGLPYSCAQGKGFTLIYSRPGALSTADAVLFLKDTPCEQLILLGACGSAAEDHTAGKLILVKEAVNMESFSHLLKFGPVPDERCPADPGLLERLRQATGLPAESCATFGSIKLEDEYLEKLREKDITVIDMECSAFLAAGAHIQKPAAALLYISDIIGQDNVYLIDRTSPEIRKAQKKAANLLLQFAAS